MTKSLVSAMIEHRSYTDNNLDAIFDAVLGKDKMYQVHKNEIMEHKSVITCI